MYRVVLPTIIINYKEKVEFSFVYRSTILEFLCSCSNCNTKSSKQFHNVDERSLSMYKRARLLSLCRVMVERKYFLSRRILEKLRYTEVIFFSWISLPGQCPGMLGPRYAFVCLSIYPLHPFICPYYISPFSVHPFVHPFIH